MDRKPKTTFQLDSPYTAVEWPHTSFKDQEIILEVLCSLLSEIGQHRSNHITSSKGKRSQRRKRHEATIKGAPMTVISPPPEISSFLAIGLNSIIRSLQFFSQKAQPIHSVGKVKSGDEFRGTADESKEPMATEKRSKDNANHPLINGHFSAVFVCRTSQSTILHDYLPQLVCTASLAYAELPATRLVELPNGSDRRLCEALGIPRVSFIGILEGAPHSKPLVDLVRECVPEIGIPWLQQARESKFLPVKVKSIETFSSVVRNDQA